MASSLVMSATTCTVDTSPELVAKGFFLLILFQIQLISVAVDQLSPLVTTIQQ